MEDCKILLKFECIDCEIIYHMYLEDKDYAIYCPNCSRNNIRPLDNVNTKE
jgi:hypothetical protein